MVVGLLSFASCDGCRQSKLPEFDFQEGAIRGRLYGTDDWREVEEW